MVSRRPVNSGVRCKRLNIMEKPIVDEYFKHYRNSGVALSLTLISISSALFIWGRSILIQIKSVLIIVQMLLLGSTILTCIGIQFCNYQGYKFLARTLTEQATKEDSDKWFRREDFAVYGSLALFVLGLLSALIAFAVYT